MVAGHLVHADVAAEVKRLRARLAEVERERDSGDRALASALKRSDEVLARLALAEAVVEAARKIEVKVPGWVNFCATLAAYEKGKL